ncbi:glycosyltransferase family 2 protein [Ekhidna sp.]|uniref:glycosyltransferase n=1 Tax=Ekhidna sp. TaxID=2608089 RepID=UPI003515394E
MHSLYLERYAWPHELFPDYQPPSNLSLIVVIPCFKEPDLIGALEALNACEKPQGEVLIIVVVNESEDAPEAVKTANDLTLKQLKNFRSAYPLLVSHQKLPAKKAGVGLARKIGMDEAVRIFRRAGNDGGIVCYDADCRCDTNYLDEIELAYSDPGTQSGIVFYEHQLHRENHEATVDYELYLRYYIDALRFASFPYAHQTLGSCITVRTSMYEKVGGMNTRKAGEDFYFLNKTIPHGGFVEINSTTIRPSDRVSDRVPFGTGKAMNEIINSAEEYSVYHPNTFEDLKLFFSKVDTFWAEENSKIPRTVATFLGDNWQEQINEVKSKVSSQDQFKKRFFHWFDAFKILKFVHFCRDEFYQNVELEEALDWLRQKHFFLKGSKQSYLVQMRYLDREVKV